MISDRRFIRSYKGYVCKMADRQVELSPPLCFLLTKLNKLDIKRIKNVMYDYCSADDITRAKDRIVGDVTKLQIDGLPRISSRRDSTNRSCLEIDDMFSLITVLDER